MTTPDPRTDAPPGPGRLAEITEHLTDHQDIHEDNGWWQVAQLKEWQQAAAAKANLVDERGREVMRLRAMLDALAAAVLHQP